MWQAGDKLGRFRLDREIGQGSHGVVWIATDTALDTPVAVKILHPWLTQDTAVRDRFKRELLLARRIAHPGVCRLFDLHEEGEAFFITMDYVEGETLLNILKNDGRIEPARAVRILRGVCQALAAAHAAGVIHRDLKPANIIVRAGDNPMILDFGTATAQDVSRVTRPGTAVGSMRFIAPEVFTGVAPSSKTDIYSLGVVAYVTLAGKLPYNAAAGAIEMLEMIRNQPPLRIDVIQPDVPARLADVVGRAMEKNPDARFASALAFDEALAEVEQGFAGQQQAFAAKPTVVTGAGGTGDFARWAPSSVIREGMGDGNKPLSASSPKLAAPAPVPSAAEGPTTLLAPVQASQTVVDARMPLSLGSELPREPSSELPLVTGAALVLPSPAKTSGGEPHTDENPRPASLTDPGSDNGHGGGGDTLEGPRVSDDDDDGVGDDDEPVRALEPTVRIAKIDLEPEERAAVRGAGFALDRRVAIAAGVVAVVLVAVVVALVKGGDDVTGAADAGAGVVPVAVLAADAGAGAGGGVDVDAGGAALVAENGGEGEGERAAAGEGEGEGDAAPMTFGVQKGPRPDPKVEGVISGARRAMVQKGILPADLPAVEAQLDKAHALNARGKRADAEKLAQAGKAAVEAQNIDRAFVMQKLGRFNKAFDKSKRPDIADKVEPLAREAGQSFSAGQFDVANKKLNRAFALVGKPR